jgi:Na+/melibiose symporter-like transporter
MDYFRLFKRKIVRQLILTELIFGLAAGMASSLMLFFFTRVKGLERADISYILIIHSVMALIATPLWARMAMKIGKHRALGLSGLVYFFAQGAMFFIPQGDMVSACVVAGITGTVLGSVSLLPRAMMADISDVERLESDVDRTGLFFALLIGTWKIGQALSVGVTFLALDLIGFSAKSGAVNGAGSLAGLGLFYTVVPAVLSLLGGLYIWRFPLTAERHGEVRRALAAREAAAAQADTPDPAAQGLSAAPAQT